MPLPDAARPARSRTTVALAGLSIALAAALVVLLARPGTAPVSSAGLQRVADFSLLDQQGRHHQLTRYAGSRAVVLFVHGVGCNIARDSLPALRSLREQFTVRESDFLMPLRRQPLDMSQGFAARLWQRVTYRIDRFLNWQWRREAAQRNVEFLMLNANPQDDRAALQADARALGIDFPILRDDTQLVAQDLKIGRTAQALLIDTHTWTIVYRGPVDDMLHFEGRKPRAGEHYLRDAIEAVIAGRDPAPAPPVDLGCAVTELPRTVPAYSTQVAPLLAEKCTACHRAGGVAPWAMDQYATVKGWSAMVREVVASRRMPPWHADPAIGHFSNDRSLTPAQIRLLTDWVDAGAPRGDGPDPLQAPRPAAQEDGWPLGPPDLVIEAPRQEVPASGVLDYRYADAPVTLDRDVWVRAVHLRPGNPALVHHSFAFVKFPPGAAGKQVDFKNGENGFFAAYVPGFDVLPFPQGSGQFLPRGTTVQFQLHYTPVGRAGTDVTRLGIYLHKEPPQRELVVASAFKQDIRIPPHLAGFPVSASFKFGQDARLHGLFPHMHLRGRDFRFEARFPDGRRQTVLSVPRFQFDWQGLYNLSEPLAMPANTEILALGTYDNSALNPANPDPARVVHWGLQTFDEMFIGYLLFTVPRQGTREGVP